MSDLFKEADSFMYREKLYRSKSARGAIVKALMQALNERGLEREDHTERMQKLVLALVAAAGLPEHEIVDMRLLVQFHDIGKVGVPDHILFKAGLLNPEEAAKMRMHGQIGYSIAQSSSDLFHIAD